MECVLPNQAEMLLQSTECFHIVHLACFKARAIETLIEGTTLQCPTCDEEIAHYEMQGVLLPEELHRIEEK